MTTRCRDIQRNINNSSFYIYVTAPFTISLNISASSGRRRMKQPPIDAARRGGSNELRHIILRSLDAEIFNETHFFKFLIFNFEIWTRTVRSDQFWLDWIWTDLILIRFKLNWTELISSKFFWTEYELQIKYIGSDLNFTDQFRSVPIRSVFF